MAGLLSKDAEKYLGQRSKEFGDIEFVGGLVDSLTSNRYYPGEGGNAGMDALAGSNTGLGPDRIGGVDDRVYRNMVNKQGWGSNHLDKLSAKELATIDPDYRKSTTAADLNDSRSGGKYQGATGYNDPQFGLVKLGLFGNGFGDVGGEMTEDIIDNFVSRGAKRENVEGWLYGARMGDQESIEWVKKYLPPNLQEDFKNRYPGGLLQEKYDWVGGITSMPGLLNNKRKYGHYLPRTNEINIDTNVRGIDQTTTHELMHRGIGALEREYRAYGQLPGANTNTYLTTDPDTGRKITIDEFLRDRWMGEADRESSGPAGHGVEHNMINAVSRNRAKRSNFLGVRDPREFGDIGKQNRQRRDSAEGLGRLGTIANAIVDQNQKDKYNWVKDTRERMDTPRVYGGKSGTKVHPLLAAAGY